MVEKFDQKPVCWNIPKYEWQCQSLGRFLGLFLLTSQNQQKDLQKIVLPSLQDMPFLIILVTSHLIPSPKIAPFL